MQDQSLDMKHEINVLVLCWLCSNFKRKTPEQRVWFVVNTTHTRPIFHFNRNLIDRFLYERDIDH